MEPEQPKSTEVGSDNPPADSEPTHLADKTEPVENHEGETQLDTITADKPSIQRKQTPRKFRGNQQGKTLHPNQTLPSKEIRELSRKHALLEKNLKIEGLPAPAKFRKRRLSLGASSGRPHEKESPYKRKRLASVDVRKGDHMPKWELMGGDAQDPLNLNGLADSEEGRLLNLKTPESSPLPTPDFRKVVYVKVPPNIEDPLNLEGKHDQSEIDRLLNATIKKRHRTKKKKHDDSCQSGSATTDSATASASTTPPVAAKSDTSLVGTKEEKQDECPKSKTETEASKTKQEQLTPKKSAAVATGSRSRSRSISMSPERRFKRQLSGTGGAKGRPVPAAPQFKYPEKPKFTLGNYNRYYGYRNAGAVSDPRMQYFNPKWFKAKDVLDIGCNVGHLTLAIADQLQPHKILGMDIDGKLIQAARQNIRHILSQRRKDSTKYPTVLEMTRGPLEAHPLMGSSDQFPNNILFLQGNYIPGSEEILNLQKEEYDTILALSITKWIHLNNGDNGLKLFFRKIFKQLRPGGKLVLEPQPWATYRKRAKLAPELFSNYQAIKLKPEGFKHYLLSIGFVKCEVIGVPVVKAKGFRRPLLLFTKQDTSGVAASPSSMCEEVHDYSNICQECGSEDKSRCDHHPQFAGMRRGPYASYLYDHVNYPPYASDSPGMRGGGGGGFNSFHSYNNTGGGGYRDAGMDYGYLDDFGYHMNMRDRPRLPSADPLDDDDAVRGEVGGNSIYSRSASSSSSRSWTSGSRSGSMSSSTSSTPASGSTGSSSGSYYSPEALCLPNGDVPVQMDGAYFNGESRNGAHRSAEDNGLVDSFNNEELVNHGGVNGNGGHSRLGTALFENGELSQEDTVPSPFSRNEVLDSVNNAVEMAGNVEGAVVGGESVEPSPGDVGVQILHFGSPRIDGGADSNMSSAESLGVGVGGAPSANSESGGLSVDSTIPASSDTQFLDGNVHHPEHSEVGASGAISLDSELRLKVNSTIVASADTQCAESSEIGVSVGPSENLDAHRINIGDADTRDGDSAELDAASHGGHTDDKAIEDHSEAVVVSQDSREQCEDVEMLESETRNVEGSSGIAETVESVTSTSKAGGTGSRNAEGESSDSSMKDKGDNVGTDKEKKSECDAQLEEDRAEVKERPMDSEDKPKNP